MGPGDSAQTMGQVPTKQSQIEQSMGRLDKVISVLTDKFDVLRVVLTPIIRKEPTNELPKNGEKLAASPIVNRLDDFTQRLEVLSDRVGELNRTVEL